MKKIINYHGKRYIADAEEYQDWIEHKRDHVLLNPYNI